ncbi:MAG: hypothetical protein HC817_14555, partial [Saprospiraceae bacterium]|nr:hypothetical protein [Saprospiraceae bacterium]
MSFLVQYLATMLCYALVWFFLPTCSLFFFILISAWHFGETDLEKVPNTLLWRVAQFTLGLLVLGFLLFTHSAEITPLWSRLVRGNLSAEATWLLLVEYQAVILLNGSLFFILLAFFAHAQSRISLNLYRYTRLAVIFSFLLFFTPSTRFYLI